MIQNNLTIKQTIIMLVLFSINIIGVIVAAILGIILKNTILFTFIIFGCLVYAIVLFCAVSVLEWFNQARKTTEE